MTILIQNLTNETKQICRFGGSKLYILPNNIITFECTNTQEVSYWGKQSIRNLDSVGLKVVVDPTQINYLIKLRNAGKLASVIGNDNTTISNNEGIEAPAIVENNITSISDEVTVVESTVEEAKEPENIINDNSADTVENIVETSIPADVVDNTTVEEVETTVEETKNVETVVEYTREYLSTLSKEELQNILIDKDISFKKNNSVNKLISLILGE